MLNVDVGRPPNITARRTWRGTLRRAVANPGLACGNACAVLRGFYYRWKFKLLGQRVVIGRRFQVRGPLIIKGPGTVIFGDDCQIYSPPYAPATPFTHSPDAVIRIGNRVMMRSTRLGCASRIEVEDDVDLADCRIMDTDFHSIEITDVPRRKTPGVPRAVIIKRRAWIAAGAMVTKGVTVGENAIVGAGAVAMTSVPANTVVAGNPARVVWWLKPMGTLGGEGSSPVSRP